jgi:hypothetical protein
MKGRVFWMTDPEADAIKSPFVRQPHYNDLENRIRDLEAALREIGRGDCICSRAQEAKAALSGARTADEANDSTKGD